MQKSWSYQPWSSIAVHFCLYKCFHFVINIFFSKRWAVQRPGLLVCVCICSVYTEVQHLKSPYDATGHQKWINDSVQSFIFAIKGAEKGAASDTEGGAGSRHPAPQQHRQVQRALEAWWKPLALVGCGGSRHPPNQSRWTGQQRAAGTGGNRGAGTGTGGGCGLA